MESATKANVRKQGSKTVVEPETENKAPRLVTRQASSKAKTEVDSEEAAAVKTRSKQNAGTKVAVKKSDSTKSVSPVKRVTRSRR